MDCLKDYIGIRWCNGTVPPSGVYINDSAGISLKQLSAIAGDEQKTALGAWDEIQTRALRRFKSLVYAELNKRYAMFNVKHSYNLGRQIDLTTADSPNANLCGFTCQMNWGQFKESLLAGIYVQSLSFYANVADAGTLVEFMIFDTVSGEKLFTDEITLVEGWNKIEVNETFPDNIFCCFDSSSIFTYSKIVNVYQFGVSQLGDCALKVKGGKTDDVTDILPEDITEGDDTFGLTGIFSTVCSWDNLVCNNKGLFTKTLLHCLECETDIETIYSDRFNRYTTTSAQRAKELLEMHTDELTKEVSQACSGIHIDTSDACLDCNEVYKLKEVMP